ncbi:MAG: hypothetical protein ACYTAF_09170 [Planctomycetota bacterium]|jgi:hypothetical protein
MKLYLLAAALLLLVPAQDEPPAQDAIRDWISRLGSDDPLEALAARDGIVHTGGEKALPLLGDAHGAIRDEIGQNRKLAGKYGSPVRVTCNAEDASPHDVFAKVEEQTGERFTIPANITAENASVALDGVPFWPAIDRVCAAFGLQENLAIMDNIRIVSGTSPDRPRFLYGPFRFLITAVRINRTARSTGTETEMHVVLHVAWQANVHAQGIPGPPAVARITDAEGRSLVMERPEKEKKEGKNEGSNTAYMYGRSLRYGSLTIRGLRAPPAGARKLGEFSGTVPVAFSLRETELSIKDPVNAVGETHEGEGFRVRILACDRPSTYSLNTEVEIAFDEPDDPAIRSVWAANIRLHTTSGGEIRARLGRMESKERKVTLTLYCHGLRRGMEPAVLVLRIPREIVVKDVPFCFRDVEIK